MAASDILFADVKDLLFRDIRNLSKPSGRGASKQATAEWLAGLENVAPDAAALAITERLADALAREQDPNKRLALLANCELASSEVMPLLEQATATASLPLTAVAQHVALAADSLLKAMSIGYGRLAEGLDEADRSPDNEEAIQQAALRAIRILGRRQMLAYSAGVNASTAAWQTMHELYALTRRHQMSGTKDDHSSIDQEYVSALLFAVADPIRMPRETLQNIRGFIAALAPRVIIEETTAIKADRDPASLFLLWPGRGRGGHGMSRMPEDKLLPPKALVIDCTALVSAIDGYLEPQGQAEQPLPAEILRLLREAWAGVAVEKASPVAPTMTHADMTVGYKDVLAIFAAASGRRKASSGDQDHEGSATSEWLIVNESHDAFSVRHLGGQQPHLDIGDVVALRPREQNPASVCLVCRISPPGGQFELGLQQLCTQASSVNLPSDDITAFGRQAIFLPQLPGFGNAAGVIAEAGSLMPQAIISKEVDGLIRRFRLGSRVATSTAIEFYLLQTV